MKVAINSCIPKSQGIFEPIQGSLHLTHIGLIPMSHKAFCLFNVDFLFNFYVEEGPSKHNINGDDSFDGSISRNMRKFFIIVYSFFLSESMSYKYGFIIFSATINNMLDFVNPSRRYHKLPYWSRNNFQHIIFHN